MICIRSLVWLGAVLAAVVVVRAEKPVYPPTRVDIVRETLHGVTIEDPYRWLENGESPETRAWVEAQNALTDSQLAPYSAQRAAIAEKLAASHKAASFTAFLPRGKKYFYTRREGGENHAIVYMRDDDVDGPSHAVLNPNEFSADGTVALDWWYPSPDGSLIAYGRSSSGDEKSTLYLRDTKSLRDTMLHIPHTRACTVAWSDKSDGFAYTRYPAPGSVPAGDENYNRHVYYHKFGTLPDADVKLFGDGQPREQWHDVAESSNSAWQFLSASLDWARNDLHYRRSSEAQFRPLAVGLDGQFSADVLGEKLLILTNFEAPRFRVLATDVNKPEREHWQVLIPQQDGIVQSMHLAGGKIVLHLLENVSSKLRIYEPDGKLAYDVELPALGYVSDIQSRHDQPEFYFVFESFAMPQAVYACDARKGTTRVVEKNPMEVDRDRYDVKQIAARSKDGTRVPIFVVHRKGVVLDGKNPTLLFGYGGFNIPMTARYAAGIFPWLDGGGVYAVACLRGGGEFGREWHEAGRGARKQNGFDDMIACCEQLIADKYTSPAKLVLRGGSNGGLLMGAMITQRPDLFRACNCAVPLLDMIRYHQFSIARLWIPEYGSADDAEQFKTLLAYSPYHHVKKGEKYPAVLFTSGESDSRVDPLHARKMAALLQAANGSQNPILLRLEQKAGHGAGKPLSKRLDELADVYTFLMWQVGMLDGVH